MLAHVIGNGKNNWEFVDRKRHVKLDVTHFIQSNKQCKLQLTFSKFYSKRLVHCSIQFTVGQINM